MPPGRRREGGFAKDLVIRISFRRGAAAKHFSVTVGIVCGRALLLGFLNPREAWPLAAAAPDAAALAPVAKAAETAPVVPLAVFNDGVGCMARPESVFSEAMLGPPF